MHARGAPARANLRLDGRQRVYERVSAVERGRRREGPGEPRRVQGSRAEDVAGGYDRVQGRPEVTRDRPAQLSSPVSLSPEAHHRRDRLSQSDAAGYGAG